MVCCSRVQAIIGTVKTLFGVKKCPSEQCQSDYEAVCRQS